MRWLPVFVVMIFLGLNFGETEAKKIKNSFKIEKEGKSSGKSANRIKGIEISITDTLNSDTHIREFAHDLKQCRFAGYDKEVNSNIESFILINDSGKDLAGFKLRIDYLDMSDRKLHTRDIEEKCNIPAGETRRLDIKSWDLQHTYYYYLGNKPRKVATPYKVSFSPVSFWIREEEQ